ncbi:hypothetical protein [Burkholderia territorii]|uniref:hypothetical protein n=1 Tax=Burkholderia territorii TaxID=1503055 RepID=UPI000A88C1EE|nr:hypothetical protein [Burkholderia territorii]
MADSVQAGPTFNERVLKWVSRQRGETSASASHRHCTDVGVALRRAGTQRDEPVLDGAP